MKETWTQDFAVPGSEYRGKPFWAWNGTLDPEELRRQVRVMHRMGLGGFFMHSRVGLNTAYLSKEWFECVNACLDEAKQLNMEAWLYDEDRWPSGAAGGLVTKNPKYRMRQLKCNLVKDLKSFRWCSDTLAAFTAHVKDGVADNVQRLTRARIPHRLATGETLLVFSVQVQPNSSWHNGYTYLDTLNHEAVKEFIRVTHEAYCKNVGADFAKTIPGIFTDEPNHGGKIGHNDIFTATELAVPWTGALPATFRKRYGYDLAPHLPELFFDIEGKTASQPRYHYHDCVTHLFVDAFARQIGEWCDKNKLMHTGHVLEEDTLARQTNQVGSCMRFYEHMQAPGMDLLTEHWQIYNTAKQVSSAARQFGRKWRLTETYGCTGWDFPFLGHKALGDWQVALGINLRCQHLSWYTMEGQTKRDYPGSISYQSPWWDMYSKVEDYFARIHAIMTRGEEIRDVLVLHPVESTWLRVRQGWGDDKSVQELQTGFDCIRDALLQANIDYDYGDEELLARHGSVAKKKGVPLLRFGKATYTTVVVPYQITMRSSTLRLLQRFRDTGGTVVFAGQPADYLDAQPSDAVKAFSKDCLSARNSAAIVNAVEPTGRRVSIADKSGAEIAPGLHLLREDKEAYYLFICNTGHDWKNTLFDEPMARDRNLVFPAVTVRGFADCSGAPIELNPDTGAMLAADATRTKGGWTIRTSLPALGSRLFVIPKRKSAGKLPQAKAPTPLRRSVLKQAAWNIRLSDDNCAVLDRPAYRIGAKSWKAPTEVLNVDRTVRDALSIPHRGGQMVQPWAREATKKAKNVGVELRYTFDAKAIPGGACHIALEQAKRYTVELNGTRLSTDADAGWWVDQSLRKLPFDPALLRTGENELVLQCDYDEAHPGFEIVYLLGDFGVKTSGTNVTLTDAPQTLRLGDWVKQGLAFYSGSVSYCKTIRPKLKKGERLFVEVPSYRGTAVRVLANGNECGIIAWQPNEIEITDFLNDEPLELAIQVLGHRRNSHGPLHNKEKWPTWTGPDSYGDEKKAFQLVPCGLIQAPVLSIRK